MGKKSLIIVAHQDDEALSCGCYILDRLRRGHRVTVVTVYGRVYDYGRQTVQETQSQQTSHFLRAKQVLGYQQSESFNLQEGEPSRVGYYAVLENLESLLQSIGPDEVVIPSPFDLNQDHQFLNGVCRVALRSGALPRKPFRALECLAFDRTHTHPNWFVPHNEADMSTKLAAVECYESEVRAYPHPRSALKIRAQHEVWGGMVNTGLAEAYNLLLCK